MGEARALVHDPSSSGRPRRFPHSVHAVALVLTQGRHCKAASSHAEDAVEFGSSMFADGQGLRGRVARVRFEAHDRKSNHPLLEILPRCASASAERR